MVFNIPKGAFLFHDESAFETEVATYSIYSLHKMQCTVLIKIQGKSQICRSCCFDRKSTLAYEWIIEIEVKTRSCCCFFKKSNIFLFHLPIYAIKAN